MNFIKVNELYKKVIEHCDYCESQSDFYPQKCKTCDFDYVSDLIDNCEKFDAIPIVWIENQIAKHGDYEESWNYQQLIDDWRKTKGEI